MKYVECVPTAKIGITSFYGMIAENGEVVTLERHTDGYEDPDVLTVTRKEWSDRDWSAYDSVVEFDWYVRKFEDAGKPCLPRIPD